MVNREAEKEVLVKKLRKNPGVVILGARQVGKTTLAKQIKEDFGGEYYDLESINVQRLFNEDAESVLRSNQGKLIILDEIQVVPYLFGVLRSVIDITGANGQYLILGSANPQLVKGVSESLAGRVAYVDLEPFHLSEVQVQNMNRHWLRGGYPKAYLAEDPADARDWLRDYIRSYVERDFNLLFNIQLNTSLIRRMWTMLAHLNSSLLNYSSLSRSLGVSANTVTHYLEVLEGAYMIFMLRPWYTNIGKRLVKSPKIYFKDTGLLHSMLDIISYESLIVNPIVGASWENYVIIQISKKVKSHCEVYFYRTHNGSEIDLLLVKSGRPWMAIEIKNSNNPSVPRGFYIAIEDLNTPHNFLITKSESLGKVNNVEICSLDHFLTDRLPFIIQSTSS